MFLILLAILLLTLIYFKAIKPYNYWIDRGIKQRNQIYVLGDNAGVVLKKDNFVDLTLKLYNAFPNERYFGVYQFLFPTLLVRDPELIKQITVKDFDHFVDHRSIVPEGVDPLGSRHLFGLQGDRWRVMRATLSPSFTSNKMKTMFPLISECALTFTSYFSKNGVETIALEMKEIFSRYTTDVIATTVFGIKCDSMKDTNNEFFVMGTKAANFTGILQTLRILILSLAPGLCKILGITLFDKAVREFFIRVVTETIKTREENNIVRPDMLHLLMEARKERQKRKQHLIDLPDASPTDGDESNSYKNILQEELTDLDITAQAFIFFFGGFDTVSTATSFMAHELAIHPDIQEKVQEEINAILIEYNGQLTYEGVMKMKYMDMVLSEVLRLWSPAVFTDRVCVKPYTIEPINATEKPVHIQKGDVVWIPVIGLHKDPQYFPNPEVFDPERFNEENKVNIQPYTYFPFGLGPRICIGSRFAILEIKTLFAHLLSQFSLVPVDKTEIPLKLKKSFIISPEHGFWVGFKKRVSN